MYCLLRNQYQPGPSEKRVGLDDRVALEVEVADSVTLPLDNRHAQFDPPRGAVFRVAEVLQLGRADLGEDVALLTVSLDDPLGIFLE